MAKLTLIGVLLCVSGVVLLGFQSISAVMGTEGKWESLSLVDLLDEKVLAWIDQVPISGLQDILASAAEIPLFVLLIGTGILFFVLEYFIGER